MESDGSREIRREYVGGDVRFTFPARPLGKLKFLGLILIGFSVLFIWGSAKGVFETIGRVHGAEQSPFQFISFTFDLFFVVVGSFPACLGLLIMFGRCRVEWKESQLRTTEILGPFRWTRRLRKPIRKLEIAAATSTRGHSAPRQFERFSGLAAEFEDGTKKIIVLGYPKDWLLGLAAELKPYISSGIFASSSPVEIVETSPLDENGTDVVNQPLGSRVQVEDRVNGVRLVVPPAGLWHGSKGLFFISLFCCSFMCVFTGFSIFSQSKGSENVPVIFWVIIPVFWLIGVGLLASAVNMGRRSAEISADSGRLRIEIKGLFGLKQREWSRAEIAAVRADTSGIEVNECPVIELQIHPRTGKKAGFLSGRDEDELRWMATRLRRALNVPARIN